MNPPVEAPTSSASRPAGRQLLAAARDEAGGLAHLQLRRLVDLLAGLVVARYLAREDECLRLRPTLREPALDACSTGLREFRCRAADFREEELIPDQLCLSFSILDKS